MRSLTWDQVYARRLRASRLDQPGGDLLEVTHAICGAHAQLMTGAELAISARVEGITRENVRDALWERRALVKGGTLRTTLHLHPSDDFALWTSIRGEGRWHEETWRHWQELTLEECEYLRDAVLAVLDDGEPRTRVEIGAAVGGPLGERMAADSWGHTLSPASLYLCHGPPRGRHVTFVRCDRWLPGWKPIDPAVALHEACRRYLETYGPVRRDELEHWFAWKVPMWDELGLEEVDVEGYRTYVLPGTEFANAKPSGVRLLWHYDVYVIACHPRTHLMPLEKDRIFLRGAGPSPTVLADGRVAGTWTRKQRGKTFEISVTLFRKLTKAQRAELADDASRVARTYGAKAKLV